MSSAKKGVATEATPLLQQQQQQQQQDHGDDGGDGSGRYALFLFLEAKTSAGKWYEQFIVILILLNIIALILGSMFLPEYNNNNNDALDDGDSGWCTPTSWCDRLWLGNFAENGVAQSMLFGLADQNTSTSVLEVFTIFVFTIEYIFRLYVCDYENPVKYGGGGGIMGRLRYMASFFSVVDLASTLPFYIDAFLIRNNDSDSASSTQFLRMFRLIRMMRVEGGRYHSAFRLIDDVYETIRGMLGTALFIGATTWLSVSSLYYILERRNEDMIYCPGNCGKTDDDGDVDTSLCEIDEWGVVNCTAAGCPMFLKDDKSSSSPSCYNLYESIPMASYYSLLNLFGEFPLIDQHSVGGKIVGTFTAVVAVAVFALPVGIIGNGFETVIAEQREAAKKKKEMEDQIMKQKNAGKNNDDNGDEGDGAIVEASVVTPGFYCESEETMSARLYNIWHAQNTPTGRYCDYFINFLVLVTALTFMLDTTTSNQTVQILFDSVEFGAVVIFTLEYCVKLYSVMEDPKYAPHGAIVGRFMYMTHFLPIVDLLSFLPYWIDVLFTGFLVVSPAADPSSSRWLWSNLVKSLRLLRILRFEKYTHAFMSFDDAIARNLDVLTITAFSALLIWILFGVILYLTERDNPDPEMASNYNNIPNSLWITLLNLSGEAPLAQYSLAGKIATGLVMLIATGIFGIPIGVLGAGFEEIVEEENKDDAQELANSEQEAAVPEAASGEGVTSWEQAAYNFVNGLESSAAQWFEFSIYVLIFLTVGVGVWQTVEGQENAFHQIEWIAVIVFTVEYVIRFYGSGADPEFIGGDATNEWASRLRFLVSFYSIIDLLAIVPFYLAVAMPSSFINDYDEYLRMLRIFRLLKLDKYVPSISLIDDVIRLKFNALKVALYAAGTLWVLFAALMFLFEHNDTANDLDDPVPQYGCYDDCTMADRFQNFFDSMVYTGIHLTGDYPITTYTWAARCVCFFMVISAVGVVSIPSGLIASGFVEIVQTRSSNSSTNKKVEDGGEPAVGGRAGDDWYEIKYRELEGSDAPPSRFGPTVDTWQIAVNEFLNGRKGEDGHTQWTTVSYSGRVFIFTIIISNVFAVLLESIPAVDRAVGNQAGNFFDVFEEVSVFVFATEYGLRLFCARKNREALYSPLIYATTFFGIVDFLSTAPWFVEQALIASGALDSTGDSAKIFRIFRIFRILQLEDFVTAFSKLDNVFRASKDVFKATALMAMIIWVGCGACFFIFEENNPNWRSCEADVPVHSDDPVVTPGCLDFPSTDACNAVYPGKCSQKAFTNMPDALYYTAVFLGGEWGVVDFTWPGRLVCLFLCIVGIALYAIPVGSLFDAFGAVLGLGGDDEEEEEEGEEE